MYEIYERPEPLDLHNHSVISKEQLFLGRIKSNAIVHQDPSSSSFKPWGTSCFLVLSHFTHRRLLPFHYLAQNIVERYATAMIMLEEASSMLAHSRDRVLGTVWIDFDGHQLVRILSSVYKFASINELNLPNTVLNPYGPVY